MPYFASINYWLISLCMIMYSVYGFIENGYVNNELLRWSNPFGQFLLVS